MNRRDGAGRGGAGDGTGGCALGGGTERNIPCALRVAEAWLAAAATLSLSLSLSFARGTRH